MNNLINEEKNAECLNLKDIRLKAEKYNWLEKSEKENSYVFYKDNVKIHIIDLKGLVTIEVKLLNGISYKMCRSNIKIDEISSFFGSSNNYYSYNDIINKTILCNYNLSVKEKIDLFNKNDKSFLKQDKDKNISKCATNKVISYNINNNNNNNNIIKGKNIKCNNMTNQNFHLMQREPFGKVEKIYTKRKEQNIFIKTDKKEDILLLHKNKLLANIANEDVNNKICMDENVERMICRSKTILTLKENNKISRSPYDITYKKYTSDKFVYNDMGAHNVVEKKKSNRKLKNFKKLKKLKSTSYELLYFYNKTNKICNNITLNIILNKISYFCFFNNFFSYRTLYEYKYIYIYNNKGKKELNKRTGKKLFNHSFERMFINMSKDNTYDKCRRSKKNIHNVICPYNNIFNGINKKEVYDNYGDNIYPYNYSTRNPYRIFQIKKDKFVNHNLYIKKKYYNNNNNNINKKKNTSCRFYFTKYNTNKYIKNYTSNKYNIHNDPDKKYSIYHKKYRCNGNNFLYKDLNIFKETYVHNDCDNNINMCNYFKTYEMNNAQNTYNHLDIQTFNDIKREEYNIYQPMYGITNNTYNNYHTNKCNNMNNYIHKNSNEYNSYDLNNNIYNTSTIDDNNLGNYNIYEIYCNNYYDKRLTSVSCYMQRVHNKSYMNKTANILNKKYNNLLYSNEQMFNKSKNKKEKIKRLMYIENDMKKLYVNKGVNNNFKYQYIYEELDRFNHISPSSYKKKNQLQNVKNEIYKKLSYLKYFQHDMNKNIPRYYFFIKHLLHDYCKKKLHIWLKVMLVKQKCGYCNEHFENIDILENHLKYVKTHKVFYCCQKPFPSLKYLYIHLKRKNHYGYIYYY
ncbi:hypothetical protein PRSY57_1208400 [Plasmodium reichenowi]|uniref:Uncharacterized protein n=1 Tax=Plasmodium reichenowi TaxID=5854 RepID=A0A151L8C4_PLARE|nr:hypothetical protein PRSY57_1208400 [Plasmodium reichenowi]KYN95202.1 hypothetical protein PRSY57_1208400 [Plasmodium reichenowi]